jgi:hypothetical protein
LRHFRATSPRYTTLSEKSIVYPLGEYPSSFAEAFFVGETSHHGVTEGADSPTDISGNVGMIRVGGRVG